MDEKKDELLFQKRLKELAITASIKGFCTYTDFLNLNEISIFHYVKKEFPKIGTRFSGGYPGAERQILCFYNEDYFSEPTFDICCIHISPLNKKFSDSLTHRDFLGAIINLGIDRGKLGDILIKDKDAFLFCSSKISTYIVDNLSKIKHTTVSCEIISFTDIDIRPNFLEVKGTIASPRLDAIISMALNSSRSSLTELIQGGKVFVNGKLNLSTSYLLKENDIVSIRGHGKFIFMEILNQTKKGRFYITLLKYI